MFLLLNDLIVRKLAFYTCLVSMRILCVLIGVLHYNYKIEFRKVDFSFLLVLLG